MSRKKIPSSLRTAVWTHYNGKKYTTECFTGCGTTISAHNFECGHVIAVTKNGPNTLANLRPICSNCNKSMGTNNMDEFIEQYGFKKASIKKKSKKIDIDENISEQKISI